MATLNPEFAGRPLGGPSGIAAISAVAAAEIRWCRRRAPVWALVFGAAAVMLVAAYYHAHLHGVRSGHLPIAGFFAPRFRVAEYGAHLSVVLAFACCLLCFDMRHRDMRARMAEVLDARPVSNLAFLLGRFVGIIGVIWLSSVVLASLNELFAVATRPLGWEAPAFGASALARLLLFDVLPILLLWSGVTILLASVLRNRALSLGISLALFVAHVWGMANVPQYLFPGVSTLPDGSTLASDLAPSRLGLRDVLQRLAFVSFALGCVVAAGRFHPRVDGAPLGRQVSVAGLLFGLGVSCVVWLAIDAGQAVRERDDWLAFHEALAADGHRGPDITGMSGAVEIDPMADGLAIDVEIEARAVASTHQSLAFTFNPGMTVDVVLVDGLETEFTHVFGSLVVELHEALTRGDGVTVRLRATGIPDGSFAFLDSVLDIDRLPASISVGLLGRRASLFHSDYVALLPAAHWLPTSGLVTRTEGDEDRHEIFDLDLTVTVPDGWLAVGPGKRSLEDASPPRFWFRPTAPIPGVAVFAAPFQAYGARVGQVEVEVALHPGHLGNAELFAPVAGLLTERLGDLLDFGAANGIPFPYQALRIVEVPSSLRVYGGGSRMQSTTALSGVLLLKEQGWPTARFELREGDEAAVRQLDVHLRNDTVSNLYAGLARSVLEQTRATGDGSVALDFVVHRLVLLILARSSARVHEASAHDFAVRTSLGRPFMDLANHLREGHSVGALNRFAPFSDGSKVWDRASDVSLSSLDFQSDGRMSAAVLDLRGGALARLLFDLLGPDGSARLVQRLVGEHRGKAYTARDVDALLPGSDMPRIRRWITSRDSPGFLTSQATMSSVDDDSAERSHVSFHVRNDEESAGWFQIKEHYDPRWPVRVGDVVHVPPSSAVEVGVVLEKPPQELWLHPYFSRNRGAVRIPLAEGVARASGRPLVYGSEPSDWRPAVDDGIVVDDSSPRFATVDERPTFARLGFLGASDDGASLPSYRESPDHTGWSRQWAPTSWGRYRATMVRSPRGDGQRTARFSAEIPHNGRWRLDYHMPDVRLLMLPEESVGSFEITVSRNRLQAPRTVAFAAGGAEHGWSPIGTFDLVAGEVDVTLSDKTDGTHVIADAVRWVAVTEAKPDR